MITESDLYAMGMESPTAWQLMPQLCEALGINYPPEHKRTETNNMAAPLKDTK